MKNSTFLHKNLPFRIHAVIGGFHLSGAANEAIIGLVIIMKIINIKIIINIVGRNIIMVYDQSGQTVSGFKKFQPDLILPGHCTGWRAVQAS